MMIERKDSIWWGMPAYAPNGKDALSGVVYSPRSGGYYKLSKDPFYALRDLPNETRCKLAHYVARKNLEFGTMIESDTMPVLDGGIKSIPSEKIPVINVDLIDRVKKASFPNRFGRIDYLLLFYEKIKNDNVDAILPSRSRDHADQILAALMFCDNKSNQPHDIGNLSHILYFADKMGVLSIDERGCFQITPKGYDRFIELQSHPTNSKQVFIAMWFNDLSTDFCKNGISPAVKQAGFTPFRIDRKEHNDFIDDQIIVEIKKSRFLVADFTSAIAQKEGEAIARGGVYWEAGFADGLGIPVIYTCREDILDHIHFDISHRNFITWKADQLSEFAEKLKNRILATI